MNLGRYEEALASYDQALKLQPDYLEAWHNRGNVLLNLGRYEEALASYDQALKIQPDAHEAWHNRGNALLNLGKYEEALASFDQALKIQPDAHEAWHNRGIAAAKSLGYDPFLQQQFVRLFRSEVSNAPQKLISALEVTDSDRFLTQFQDCLSTSTELLIDAFVNLDAPELIVQIQQSPRPELSQLIQQSPLSPLIAFIQQPLSETIAKQIEQDLFFHSPRFNPQLNLRGYEGELASYQAELDKAIHRDTHPQGWGMLHHFIGQAHYFRGQQELSPFSFWRKAEASYKTALQTLKPPEFEALHLEVLQDLIRVLLDLQEIEEAHLLQRMLADQELPVIYSLQLEPSSPTLSVGEELEVTIHIGFRDTDSRDTYLLEIPREEVIGNELNIILKEVPPGFQLDSSDAISLPLDQDVIDRVTRQNLIQTGRFRLTALRPSHSTIVVELYRGDTFERTLETTVQVTGFEDIALLNRLKVQSRPVPQPDLTLQVSTAWNETASACTFHYHLQSFRVPLLFGGIKYSSEALSTEWLRQIYELLQSILEETSSGLAEDGYSHLTTLGQHLFQRLLPPELQRDLCNLSRQQQLSLLVLADRDAQVPWGLLHNGREFLSEYLTIGQWPRELNEMRPYEFAVGGINLAHYANIEQVEVWANLLEPPSVPPPNILPGGMFDDLASTETMRGLHLIRCGQSSDAGERSDAPVMFGSSREDQNLDRKVRPAKLNLRRNRPLVTLGFLRHDRAELTALEQTWAATFIRAGCSAFVGSLWAVDPMIESAFISNFYHALWTGESLGGAFQRARGTARMLVPDSLDWLAYVFYGDPMARPYRPVQGPGYTVIEPIGREMDDSLAPQIPARFQVSLRRKPPVWHEDRVIDVIENLEFDNLQAHIVTFGLQVSPESPIRLRRTPEGDYLGWFNLIAPSEMSGEQVSVQVHILDEMQPINSLMFSLQVENGGGV